jgi:hypothetical protein
MTYETLGKLALTGIILLAIPLIWIIGLFIAVVIDEQVQKLPQWARTTIGITGLGLITIFVGVLIYNVL